MPTNNPVIPVQPNEQQYGVDKLYTCPRFTRALYKEKFGEEAPPYSPARQIKRWFFTDKTSAGPDPELCTVQVYDPTTRTIRNIGLLIDEYTSVNLPGATSYPKYTNPSTSLAVIVDPNGNTNIKLSGSSIVDPELVKSIVAEINSQLNATHNVTFVAEEKDVNEYNPYKIVYGLESRRQMTINNSSNGRKFDAAAVLLDRFEKGVGSPGKWALGPDGGPQFTPDVPIDGEQDLRPEVPMPCRSLLPNERFAAVTFGGMGGVVEKFDPTPVQPPMGDGFTEADRIKLNEIAVAVGVRV